MSLRLSANPNKRMGVFKQIESVPERYRLHQHQTAFEGRDVWDEYLEESYFPEYPDLSDHVRKSVGRAGREWKGFMDERGRHHALATPKDVEVWTERLLDRVKTSTAQQEYWTRIEGMYSWLQNHADYPHVYHPFWMAVASYPNSREIWNHKLAGGNRQGGIWE